MSTSTSSGAPLTPSPTRQPDPRALRMHALCTSGATVEGEWPLASMPRLAESFFAAVDGSVHWSLQALTRPVPGSEPQLWARLRAHARVPLQCQRCLAPMLQTLQVDQSLRFVKGEALAERLDEESEEDVLNLPAHLNVYALLEDELILALPIVPRHEGLCPQPLLALAEDPAPVSAGATGDVANVVPTSPDEPQEPHPFAALAALKSRKDA